MRIAATGASTPDRAWRRYADLDQWSGWAPQIRSVEASGRRLRPGLTGVVRGPLGIGVKFWVIKVDRARHTWEWEVTAGGINVRMLHDLRRVPRGTRAGLITSGPAPAVLLYAPLAWVALRCLCRP